MPVSLTFGAIVQARSALIAVQASPPRSAATGSTGRSSSARSVAARGEAQRKLTQRQCAAGGVTRGPQEKQIHREIEKRRQSQWHNLPGRSSTRQGPMTGRGIPAARNRRARRGRRSGRTAAAPRRRRSDTSRRHRQRVEAAEGVRGGVAAAGQQRAREARSRLQPRAQVDMRTRLRGCSRSHGAPHGDIKAAAALPAHPGLRDARHAVPARSGRSGRRRNPGPPRRPAAGSLAGHSRAGAVRRRDRPSR